MKRAGDTSPLDRDETRRRLEREIEEVTAGIALVASGSASRVSVSGIRFGEELIERLRGEAERNGIVLVAEPWPEDSGCDLVIRRIDG
jgi:hypothetical protein